jgi:hypothetical protein
MELLRSGRTNWLSVGSTGAQGDTTPLGRPGTDTQPAKLDETGHANRAENWMRDTIYKLPRKARALRQFIFIFTRPCEQPAPLLLAC